jgi:hypothetical protein
MLKTWTRMRANNASKSLSINTFILLFLQTQVFAQFTVSNIKVEYVIDGDTFIAFVNDKKERIYQNSKPLHTDNLKHVQLI